MALTEGLRAHLDELVARHRVVLFMKGTRFSPSCGFSANVVNVLDALLADYHTVDVLADTAIRDGIKEYADWPTIPQLYVKGEFVGGADIVRSLHESGELARLLEVNPAERKAPSITLTEGAARALSEAAGEAQGLVLRLGVSGKFAYDLFFGDAEANDFVSESRGLKVHCDPASARRAEGVTIDYVVGSQGAGFRIDNPNEPAPVAQRAPQQIAAMRAAHEPMAFIDVRTPEEREIAHIEGSRLLDPVFEHELLAADRALPLVFVCHHGVRSLAAAEHFASLGFQKVYNLQGGIDAWSVTVDPSVPRY
ncbi:MAG: Grx4 family monothiol glutaredoxin [Myxococcales bacterium]|nr:Grx4 family monothiol glutaredoxin [Myxococcales bacterium]